MKNSQKGFVVPLLIAIIVVLAIAFVAYYYFQSNPKTTNQLSAAVLSSTLGSNPIGYLDRADCSTIAGWSFDPDNTNNNVRIDLYKDGPYGTGTLLTSVTANVSRPGVDTAYNVTGNYGFSLPTPTTLLDGKSHTVYAYGINLSGTSGTNTLLSGSPMTINCSHAPTGSFDAINNGVALGWAVDPDVPATPISVAIYVDGAYGAGGTFLTNISANSSSTDVTGVYPQYTGNHRFTYSVPNQYYDGKQHSLYVYGIDSTGNANVLLTGSPKNFVLSNIYVIQDDGTLVDPTTNHIDPLAVTKKFYALNPSKSGTYDFVSIFSTFHDPSTVEYHLPIQSNVKGIASPFLSQTDFPSKLLGINFLSDTYSSKNNPTESGLKNNFFLLEHETGHQWLAYMGKSEGISDGMHYTKWLNNGFQRNGSWWGRCNGWLAVETK